MRKIIFILIATLAFTALQPKQLFAPPPPPAGGSTPPCWPPPCVPIDGGAGILALVGLAAGYKLSREKNTRV